MLHIILALLKIIGIFLLILLGVFVLLVIAVLAAPITYRLTGEWNGELNLKGKISWLYHIVGIYISIKDGKPAIKVSLFGRGDDSGKSGTKKKKKSSKKKKRKKKQTKNSSETVSGSQRAVKTEEKQPQEAVKTDGEQPQESVKSAEEQPQEAAKSAAELRPKMEELEQSSQTAVEEYIVKAEKDSEFDRDSILDEEPGKAETEENGIIQLLRRILNFLKQPSVKKLIGKLWRSIRRIFRHLLPSDLHLRARIGTGDPASTGRIMEAAAVLYAFYGDKIEIVSDFEEKALEGEFAVRGWLIPGYLIIKLLGMALRVLLNKECRSLYKEMKQSLN